MMTKKDYERAARIVQDIAGCGFPERANHARYAFRDLFLGDNPRFDEARFQRACEPGANVRARRHYD